MATPNPTQSEAVKNKTPSVKIDHIADKEATLRQNVSTASALPPVRRKSILKDHVEISKPIEIVNKHHHAHFSENDIKEASSPSAASPCTLSAFPKEQHPRALAMPPPLSPMSLTGIESYLEPVTPRDDLGRRTSQTFDTFQMMKDLDDFRP
ncbi:unnamed protein product [Meganyctiphanes norvegica]|uniref:Uncharacterized protein n=1 Tax=Meganyctiphanes norvegica TaxID=48144 RepID=A0AAV2RPR1_MEGNR